MIFLSSSHTNVWKNHDFYYIPLDKEQVGKLLKLIEEKFKNDQSYKQQWDVKAFISKGNQKCQDALRHVKQKLKNLNIDHHTIIYK